MMPAFRATDAARALCPLRFLPFFFSPFPFLPSYPAAFLPAAFLPVKPCTSHWTLSLTTHPTQNAPAA